MLLILLLIIIILFIGLIFCFKSKNSKNNYRNSKRYKGIVFFDIDDTLTNTSENVENLISYCLNENYKVGIITASNRPIDYVCNSKSGLKNNFNSPWMSNLLCKHMAKDNFKTYNTLSLTNGKNIKIPYEIQNPPYTFRFERYGLQKGWQMKKCAKENNIEPSKTYLFDDNTDVLRGAKRINPQGTFVHVDNKKLNKKLNVNMLKMILK